ncbi:DUF736 family protein [Pelagibacterium luteolum]|uniref:Uncharacterized conserved protein, DUF736 family n=1 Tax=Pelagibacterium luteolum TaxID=440168 RepID=A0A1G7YKM2_9HYPH|nr:DUF736 family protein [Pelagibacterium luteolum]SDG96789.1 Uncharacterized conserved protein, DUF736 family [Pelagibacterium luteolum]
MAGIGCETFSQAGNGYAGSRPAGASNLNVKAIKVGHAELSGRQLQGPDFRIFAGVDGSVMNGKRPLSGARLVPVKLDDPTFPAAVYASLTAAETEGRTLVWSRRRAAE